MSTRLTGTVTPKKSVTGQLMMAEYVGGTKDYAKLDNKPQINGVELVGNKHFSELGLSPLTNTMIEAIFQQ